MSPLELCASCGNHGTIGEGRDKTPCLNCEYGREIAAVLEKCRAELRDLQAEDDEWRGHFFPSPEEMGIDPEAFPGEFGDCACGTAYSKFQFFREACPS